MKFAIFREIKKGKRKFLMEWNQKEIEDALLDELLEVSEYNLRAAFGRVIERFKKESLRIP
jgi:hypothetical protein